MFDSRISSITTGSDIITLDNVDGLIPGSNYLITDGLKSENVKILYIKRQNGINYVELDANVKNSYELSQVNLIRSTAFFVDEKAICPDEKKSLLWEPNVHWSGLGDHANFELKFETYAANINEFNLTGSATLDNQGFITLGFENV